MGKLGKALVAILLSPLIYAFAHEAYRFVIANFNFNLLRQFIYGFVAYLLAYPIIAGRRIRFIEVFEHELGHALTGLAFFQNVEGFAATPGQGLVVLDDANFLIALAPYYLPVFTIPLLFIKPFVSPSGYHIVDLLIGTTLAFHYVALLGWEFRPGQPDIQNTGLLFSLAIALLMNAVFLVLTLSGVLNNYTDVLGYLGSSWLRTEETYGTVLDAMESSDLAGLLGQLL